jgi:hypothetical protein
MKPLSNRSAFQRHALGMLLGGIVLGGCHCDHGPGSGYTYSYLTESRFALNTDGLIPCDSGAQTVEFAPAPDSAGLKATVRVASAADSNSEAPVKARGRVMASDADGANGRELFTFENLLLKAGEEQTFALAPDQIEGLVAPNGPQTLQLTMMSCSQPRGAQYELQIELGSDAASER